MLKKHTHKLKKHKYKTGAEIFFCTLPDCHFKIEAALALGKLSICNLCGNEFIMGERDTKRVRPHCSKCSKIKVRGADGKNHFVRKISIPILDDVAESTVDSLRARLDNAAELVSEEDI